MTTRRPAAADPQPVVLAFMIADIRGYSRFSREHGDAAAAALAKRFADLARDAVEARGGTVVELRGDEAFAAFPTAAQAVRAAGEFQLTCLEETERDPSLPLLVGVGIDVGPAIPVEDGYRGIAINLAARLCSSAGANQVLVTSTVAEQSADLREEVDFEPRGESSFKGFEEPVTTVEARMRCRPVSLEDVPTQVEPLPAELVDPIPLVGRVHELRWLRGTWRQVRRGRGRIVAVSGPAGIGKTRLAAELAAHVLPFGAVTRYAGPGGLATASALTAVAEARDATVPTLVVIDQFDVVAPDVLSAIAEAEIESRPVLLLLLVRDPDGATALAELVDRSAAVDGHRRLAPLSAAEVADVVALYAGEAASEAPVEKIARASRGVPALVHEQASEWARSETTRRLEAAASFMAAARERRASDLEFANNVIGLKLGSLYAPDAAVPADVETLGPYKGLASFEQDDASWFFGREQIVGELAARVVGSGALAVLGASGSGKSSLVAAGLLPSLRAGLLPGSSRWAQASLRPGERPMAALRAAVASEADDPIAAAVQQLGNRERLVLVVDQFEELFTLCPSEPERTEFLDVLARNATGSPDQFVVVLTLRSDFYGALAPYPAFAGLVADNHVLVGPLTRTELHRVVQLPAQRAGVRIETALVDALVEEAVGEPGALPLLSTALVELWQARAGGWIRVAAYRESGGIRGAVARIAEASYEQLDEADQAAAKRVLLRLASSGTDAAPTRRRVELEEFDLDRDVSARRVIERFTADRLLTVSGTTVEVAHEALLREWPRLRVWLEEDVQGRQVQQHLTAAAKIWAGAGRDRSELYRGARLTAAFDWAGDHPADLNDLERAFLNASREASQAEADAARRTNRRLRALLAGAVVLLLVAVAAGVVALVQRSSAQRASTAALADSLGAQAVSQPRLDRAMLLAREAVALDSSDRTRSELLSTVLRAPNVLRTYHENLNRLNGISLSPDGTLLALADNDDHVVVENSATGRVETRLITASNFAAFAPDGALLRLPPNATTFLGLQRVDARTGAVLGMWRFAPAILSRATVARATVPGVPAGVVSPPFAFAPNGHLAAVSMFAKNPNAPDNLIFQVAYPSGRLIAPPIRVSSTGDFPAVAYAGAREIVTHDATHIRLFAANTGRLVRSYRATVAGPDATSTDGRTFVYGAADGSLRFLDLRSGTTRSSVGAVPGGVSVMTFAEHDLLLITGGGTGAVQLWDAASRELEQTLPGQAANIVGTVVSKDSSTLYTASFDNIAVAWDLTGRRGSVPAFTAISTDPHMGDYNLAVSPDGRTLAVGSTSGRVALIDSRTFARVATLPGGKGLVAASGWSPTGSDAFAVTTILGADGAPTHSSLEVFDVRNRSRPRIVRQVELPFPTVNWASFTHDGRAVVICGHPAGVTFADGKGFFAEVRVSNGRLVAAPTRTHNGAAVLVATAPSGDRVAGVGFGGSFELIDPVHRRVIAHYGGPGELIDGVAYSPDGSTIAVADFTGQLTFINAQTGRVERRVQLIAEPLATVAYSPDGRMIATVDTQDNTRLYDSATLRQIGTTYAPPWAQQPGPLSIGHASFAQFAPDGTRVYVSDEGAGVWAVPTSAALWEADVCRIANRPFTRAEWDQYVPGRSYQPGCP